MKKMVSLMVILFGTKCFLFVYMYTCADPEGGQGWGPDPPSPWIFGKNVVIGFMNGGRFDIAQGLC